MTQRATGEGLSNRRRLRVALLTTDGRDMLHDYAAAEPSFGTAPIALIEGFAQLPEVEVHVISCVRQPARSPKKLADNIFFHCLQVSKVGWIRTFYSGCVRAVRRKVREVSADIVHGQGTERECAMAAVLSGRPNVVTLHGIMDEMVRVLGARLGSFHWLASRLESFALRRTAGVFCNSRFVEEKVATRSSKTFRVPNPVRTEFFLTPVQITKPVRPLLLNVGTVCGYKRQNELLKVAGELRAEGLDFEIHFIGVATRANAYGEAFLNGIEGSKFAFHHRLKVGAELIAAYDGASALVHVSAIETFGLVVAEALARNAKFFGFGVGGVVDIVHGLPGAEVFSEGDWIGLKNALRKWILAGAPQVQGCAEIMRQRYSPEIIARRHVEIYREVLATRS
jgi:glycosyltransferase involved in cell wall biosynthesis